MARSFAPLVASKIFRVALVRYILIVAAIGVAFWCGAAYQASITPAPIVRITKAEPVRCELIDRFKKRKEAHL